MTAPTIVSSHLSPPLAHRSDPVDDDGVRRDREIRPGTELDLAPVAPA